MATFDDEFDLSPEASFDDEFENAPEESSVLDNLKEFGADALELGKDISAPVLEGAKDFSIGAAKGATMGTMDEIGGVLSAGAETALEALGFGPGAVDAQLREQGFDIPEDSFGDKYRMYQKASQDEQKASEERSPVLNTLGQIAGGMTSGHMASGALGLGNALKTAQPLAEIAKNQGLSKAALELLKRGGTEYAKMSPLLAAEIAASSEHNIIGEDANLENVAKEVGGGLAFGLPVMLGLQASAEVLPSVSKKASDLASKTKDSFFGEDMPLMRQYEKAFNEYGGKLKVNPRSHAAEIAEGPASLSQRTNQFTDNFVKMFDDADNRLGKDISKSLNDATQSGVIVNVSPEMQSASQTLQDLAQQFPMFADSRKSMKAYETMLTGADQLNPIEVKGLIDDIDNMISIFKSSKSRTTAEESTLSQLYKYRKGISDSLKKDVPQYRDAAARFENFRQVIEQLLAGPEKNEYKQIFYGNLRDPDATVFKKVRDLIENTQRTDAAAGNHRTAFTNLMEALGDFEQKEAARMSANPNLQQVLPHTKAIRSAMLDASDDAVLRDSARRTSPSRSTKPSVGDMMGELVFGKVPVSTAYGMGRVYHSDASKSLSKLSKTLYNAPDTTLNALAAQLKNTKFKSLGESLEKSLQSGNIGKRNATLFTIMQNPEARLFIEGDDNDLEK